MEYKTTDQRQLNFHIILAIVVLVEVILLRDQRPSSPGTLAWAILYTMLYVALSAIYTYHGKLLFFGNQYLGTLGIYLWAGPVAAVVFTFSGSVFIQLVRILLLYWRQHTSSLSLRTHIYEIFRDAIHSCFAVLSAALIYTLVGGALLRYGERPDVIRVVILTVLALFFFQIPFFFLPYPDIFSRLNKWRYIVSGVATQYILLILATGLYLSPTFQVGFAGQLLILIVLLGVNVIFRTVWHYIHSLQKLMREMKVVTAANTTLATSLQLEDLIEQIYRYINQIIDAQVFYITLYNNEENTTTVPVLISNYQRVYQFSPENIDGLTGLVGHIIRTRKLLNITDRIQDYALQQNIRIQASNTPTRSFLGVPLIVEDQVIGVLVAQNTRANAFHDDDLELVNMLAAQVAIMLRNATLYGHVFEMTDKLTLLSNVSSVVSATLNLDNILQTVCEIIIEVGKADRTGIFLISRDKGSLRLAHAIGLSDDYIAQVQDIVQQDEQNSTGLMKDWTVNIIENVFTDPRGRGWRSLAEIEGYKSMMIVPLINTDERVGFIAAFYNDAHHFSTSDVDMMNTLGNHVAIAVANARLHHDTEQRARDMERLVHASKMFTSTLDTGGLVDRIIDEVKKLLAPNAIAMLQPTPTGDALRVLARQDMEFDAQQILPVLFPYLESNRLTTIASYSRDTRLLELLKLHTLHVIPLVHQERINAILLVGYHTPHMLTEQERQLTEGIINHASTALANALQFDAVDNMLDERLRELTFIEQISRKISASMDLEEILLDVLRIAIKITDCLSASCLLAYNNDPDYLQYVCLLHPSLDMPLPMNGIYPCNQGVVGRVMRTGKTAWISDIRNHSEYVTLSNMLPETRSVLCVPIINNNQCIGVLNLEARKMDAFSVSHKRSAEMLAEHAAIAINNAQMFTDRMIQIDNLSLLREMSVGLLSSSSLKGVMKQILHYTMQVTHAQDVHIYFYDALEDRLNFGGSIWWDGREDVEAYAPSPKGRTWLAAREGQPILIGDVHKAPEKESNTTTFNYSSMARLPLKRDNVVLGVMVISYREVQVFDENTIRTLELLANQASIALASAGLFEEVENARDQMQVILESAHEGMVLLGAKGQLLQVNPAAEKLLGYMLTPYLGENIFRVAIKIRKNEADPKVRAAIREGFKVVLHDVSGSPLLPTKRTFQLGVGRHYLEETTTPVVDDQGQPAGRLFVFRDISEEVEQERFREEVTNMLVHDLRAPLSSIITSLNLMNTLIEEQDFTDLAELSQVAIESGQRQIDMINTLLEIAKGSQLQIAPADLRMAAQQSINTLSASAQEADIAVINHIPANQYKFDFDQTKIERVFTNLIDNAIRHTPTGKAVRIEVHTFTERNKPFVEVSVIDQGRGIPEDMREKVFQKFVQIQKSALRGQRGTGLGLTFCQRVVMAHGGQIWADNVPEGGAAFRFTLPIIQSHTSDS